ncbi:MAG: CARDB domain-containing protein [archaeon]
MRMTEKQKSTMMQYAIIVGMLVMLFLMFFRGWGLTFKFYEPAVPGALPITVVQTGSSGGIPDLVPAGVEKGINGAVYAYTLTVQNNGDGSAGSFLVTVVDNMNGNAIGTCRINGIESGSTGACTASSSINAGQTKEVVDSENAVTENSKSNNEAIYNTP